MSSGGGTNTTQTVSGPPQQFLDAYGQVMDQAKGVASTPYQPYPGNLVAGLSPDQQQGISQTQNAQGIANPFINAAAQEIGNSTTPVLTPQVNQDQMGSTAYFQEAGQTLPFQNLTPQQIQQYQNPYTQQVIDATQAEFNNQNKQQQQGIVGNAISQGAFGGDRSAVAQGITAGQEQLAQAPVIAGLQNQSYAQALAAAQQQQQAGLSAQQASQQLQLGAGQGITGVGGQILGAQEANNWLSSQAGYGLANLGNEALSSSLTGANAELGIGGLEQQQAQQSLNVPYEQYIAQQAYPFQTTGWLSNIAEGLGGASGGTGSTTYPAPSAVSQIAGAGLAGAGILGQTGAFGSNGWLTNAFSSPAADMSSAGWGSAMDSLGFAAAARGGAIPHRAGGGIVPGGGMPIPTGVPDVSMSVVPGAAGMGDPSTHAGKFNLNSSTGSTTTTSGGQHDSVFGDLLKTAGGIAAGVYGGPAGALAANALSSQVHFDRGGGITGFPMQKTRMPGTGIGKGGITANDNIFPHIPSMPHRMAAGGNLTIDIPQIGGGIASQGPVTIPQIGAGGGGSAPSGGGINAVNNYLANTGATVSRAPPPGPAPKPVAAPPSFLTPTTGIPGEDPTAGALDSIELANGSGSGGTARGGRIGREEGGYIPDDDVGGGGIGPDLSHLTNAPVGATLGAWLHRHDPGGPPASSTPSGGGIDLDEPLAKPLWRALSHAVSNPREGFPTGPQPPPKDVEATGPRDIHEPPAEVPANSTPPQIGITGDNTTDWHDEQPQLGAGAGITAATPQAPQAPTVPGAPVIPATTGGGGGITMAPAETQPGPEGPPPPPPPPAGTDQAAQQPGGEGGEHHHWGETLMAMGLGMMAGTSPFPGVNIGRGGLEGLKFGEQQRLREEQAALRQIQAQDLAEYRKSMGAAAQQRAATGDTRAAIYGQRVHDLGTYQQAVIAGRQAGLSEKDANDKAMMEWRQGNQQINQQKADTSLAGSMAHTAQTNRRLDQTDASLELRRQALAQSKDAGEQRAIQTATTADLKTAATIIGANPGMKYDAALTMVRKNRDSITPAPAAPAAPASGGGADPLAAARSAIAAGADPEQVKQRLHAHGIDASGL